MSTDVSGKSTAFIFRNEVQVIGKSCKQQAGNGAYVYDDFSFLEYYAVWSGSIAHLRFDHTASIFRVEK
jgi:hypothetical protein